MIDFTKFLADQGYSKNSISQIIRFVDYFLRWLSKNTISRISFQYENLIDFIDSAMIDFSSRKNINATINRLLSAVSIYYDFINLNESNTLNLTKTIRLKNHRDRKIKNFSNRRELLDIYYNLPRVTDRDLRNRVIFGLLIYQALSTGEVNRLKTTDFDFENGTVYIQSESTAKLKKGNKSRTLLLNAKQILDLLEYRDKIRPRILANYYRNMPSRKPMESNTVLSTSDQFVLSMFGSKDIKNSLLHLFLNIRKAYPSLHNASQVRQSIISHWVAIYDLNTVQYMAGHRYVGSTEMYKQENINDLRREVFEYHPLG